MTTIEHTPAASYLAAAQVPTIWPGKTREILGLTLHHWGALGQKHDDIVSFFAGPAQTSAHYVVSAGRITLMVPDADVAWHAKSASGDGNRTTIGIECRPEATDADYATVAELIVALRERHGDLPLYPHRHWSSTACPGAWDLERLDALACTRAAHPSATSTAAQATTTKASTSVTTFKQLIPSLNLNAARGAGWCLAFAQDVVGAPVAHDSAWAAYLDAQYKHGVSEALPDAPAVMWFSHVGTYSGVAKNWGHVAIWIPGRGILSSPPYHQVGDGVGQTLYSTIAEIEADLLCSFVGWSEDLNGKRICQPVPAATATASAGLWWDVDPGDTLAKIAYRYRQTPAQLAQANGLSTSATLRVGQRLYIRGRASTKITAADIARGQATGQGVAAAVAERYGLSAQYLMRLNGWRENTILKPGNHVWLQK